MTENHETTASAKKQTGGGVSIRIIGAIAIIVAILLAFYTFALAGQIADLKDAAEEEERHYVECSGAVDDLQVASDYLTTQARLYVVTGRKACMDAYMQELKVDNRRGTAVELLRRNLEEDEGAAIELQDALAASNELAKSELAAMRFAAEYYNEKDLPEQIANATLGSFGEGLGPEAKLAAAKGLVLDSSYDNVKNLIRERVEASSSALLAQLDADLAESDTRMQALLFQQRIAVALLLCTVMVLVLVLFMYVLKPLSRYIKDIEKNEPLEADGAYELQYLANAYNVMYEDNNKRIEQLREFAERDALTGISNRSGYDNFLAKHTRNVALLLIDIDNFKEFNAVYGREVGNAVLVKLAGALCTAFRSTDFPCRLESDKFAVIMTNMSDDLRDTVTTKIEIVNGILADESDDVPLITFSVGAAFSAEGMDDQDIFHAAETALHQAQDKGANNIVFYGEDYSD